MKTILAFLLVFLSFIGNVQASDKVFACVLDGNLDFQLVFSVNTQKAELISDSSHSGGEVTFNNHHYFFIFPKTERRYEIRAAVNRYSGKLSWEIGAPPFGEKSDKNIHSSGECKTSEIKKLL